jgi:hypothetical protein
MSDATFFFACSYTVEYADKTKSNFRVNVHSHSLQEALEYVLLLIEERDETVVYLLIERA